MRLMCTLRITRGSSTAKASRIGFKEEEDDEDEREKSLCIDGTREEVRKLSSRNENSLG